MKKLLSAVLFLSTVAMAGAQGVTGGGRTQFDPAYDYTPVKLAVAGGSSYIATWAVPLAGGAGSGAVVNMDVGRIGIAGGNELVSNFLPVDFVNNVQDNSGDFRLVGKQIGANGRKVKYYGGGGAGPIGGNLDWLYTANGTSNDQSLKIGSFPYGDYTTANVQSGNSRVLVILHPKNNSQDPTVQITDTAISPMSAEFGGNLALAAGADNNASAPGAARASAYTMNVDGSVSSAFTKTFINTLSNHVFTSHSLLWGSFSNSLNILVDNQMVHNANNSTVTYSYTLYGYDGSGNLLWTSLTRTGSILQISVGSPRSIYVLGTRGPGQFLVSYGANGILRWSRSTIATKISHALEQGVVVADSAVDGTGHHHVHVTKYLITGPVAYTVSYSSSALNDDLLTDLLWQNGFVYVAGQVLQGGRKGLLGATWQQH